MRGEIKIGVSSCLLGHKVRYDGGQKQDPYITDILARFTTLVPVCPEVGCGLPVPREAMRLEGDPVHPRLMTISTRIDLTEKMQSFCNRVVSKLEQEHLCGFIFKQNSPSSGLNRVQIYSAEGVSAAGRGLFAAAVTEHFPLLPVEEEGRLGHVALRESFCERVFAYGRWQDVTNGDRGLGDLVEFHGRHKLQIMAHSVRHYREMGRLVAEGKKLGRGELFSSYGELLMAALALRTTVKKHTNVLLHVMGYFKKMLSSGQKHELLAIIGGYHDGTIPLIVPMTLLNHYARGKDDTYLQKQSYLNPDPRELMLRNHA